MAKNAAVIVIGDIGRSPRIANHALSLADEKGYAVRREMMMIGGWKEQLQVSLIGYTESALNERIANHEKIRYEI